MRFSVRTGLLVCATMGIAVGAFARGHYLLGWDVGIVYAVVSVGFVLPFIGRESKYLAVWQKIASAMTAVMVGLVMFFPTLVSSDIEIFIQKQAVERAVRAELKSLFESDSRYSDLSLTTRQLKIVVVTVLGNVDDQNVIEPLAERLKAVSERHSMVNVHWKVTCRETGKVTDSSELLATQESVGKLKLML